MAEMAIPEEVVVAAREHLARGEMAIMTVCRAILAERERCATIVEGIDKAGRDWAPTSFMAALRRDIAAAIRRQEDGNG